jgi:ATP-binding cassette subfamily C protein CydCD
VRFLAPERGAYRVNGVDAATLDPGELRRAVGLLDGAAHVFASSLRENLRLARPGASDDELRAALERARLPLSLDTYLGEGGALLSGGERQRLELARALLADFSVLLLDEPTAHLDSATATAVLGDLLAALEGRTLLLITHRPECLELLDAVYELRPQGLAPLDTPALAGTMAA